MLFLFYEATLRDERLVMVLVPIECLHCGSLDVIRHGQTSNGKQRFVCRNKGCGKTFIQTYSDQGRLPQIKRQIVDMALNGSGVRDTARVLDVSTATVINELKKRGPVGTRQSSFLDNPWHA